MRHLEKSDVMGKRILEIILSQPDKPVTMSDQSYSQGFLRLDSGELIDLGAYAPPLVALDEDRIQRMARDKRNEKEFRSAIGEKIVSVAFPEESMDGYLEITTASFVIAFAASCFWIRPCIQRINEGV